MDFPNEPVFSGSTTGLDHGQKTRRQRQDGRQTILSLTPGFLSMIQASRAAREDWLVREIHACYNAKEQESLAKAIELLKRLVSH